jgi:hypothetical protein
METLGVTSTILLTMISSILFYISLFIFLVNTSPSKGRRGTIINISISGGFMLIFLRSIYILSGYVGIGIAIGAPIITIIILGLLNRNNYNDRNSNRTRKDLNIKF